MGVCHSGGLQLKSKEKAGGGGEILFSLKTAVRHSKHKEECKKAQPKRWEKVILSLWAEQFGHNSELTLGPSQSSGGQL